MRLRILTYNIHKGFCYFTRRYVLHELRSAIRSCQPNIVFLQEVMGVHPRPGFESSGLESQFEFLADEMWGHHAYGKNAAYNTGNHGNAILSQYPIVNVENIDISTNPRERRGLLHVQVEGPVARAPLHLLCLHLDLFERGRRLQQARLLERVREYVPAEAPLVVAGDFNDWRCRFSAPLREDLQLEESGVAFTGHHRRTFPSYRPLLALDRVYVRHFNVRNHRVLIGDPWRRLSDHAAVLVDLELRS